MQAAVAEYRRFMAAKALFPEAELRPCYRVDQVWRTYILYACHDERFCDECLGRPIPYDFDDDDGAEARVAETRQFLLRLLPDLCNEIWHAPFPPLPDMPEGIAADIFLPLCVFTALPAAIMAICYSPGPAFYHGGLFAFRKRSSPFILT